MVSAEDQSEILSGWVLSVLGRQAGVRTGSFSQNVTGDELAGYSWGLCVI